ncbi:MAG: leucine-rich repeat domain-containing protein [Clostridia bacterium]|nr:leucine-rich repeat domain-containing protein [Clostridia bacterium]
MFKVKENGKNNCSVLGYTGDSKEVIIPSEIDGKKVTKIEKYAFANTNVKVVTISASVKVIDEYAFDGCSKLTSVYMYDGVNEIGKYAFNKCSKLTEIKMAKSIDTIGDYAFANCKSLTKIDMPACLVRLGEGVFENCSSLVELKLPGPVQVASKNLCRKCTSLQSIDIRSAVVVEEEAFADCKNLTGCSISEDLAMIKDKAFYNCGFNDKIYIPKKVVSIGHQAFGKCDQIKAILFLGNPRSIELDALPVNDNLVVYTHSPVVMTNCVHNGLQLCLKQKV